MTLDNGFSGQEVPVKPRCEQLFRRRVEYKTGRKTNAARLEPAPAEARAVCGELLRVPANTNYDGVVSIQTTVAGPSCEICC
jgi:hypothetical protein